MASANSTGGVMGKMIDAQSIVVAAAATGEGGREGDLLRKVFWHSVALALLVGGDRLDLRPRPPRGRRVASSLVLNPAPVARRSPAFAGEFRRDTPPKRPGVGRVRWAGWGR